MWALIFSLGFPDQFPRRTLRLLLRALSMSQGLYLHTKWKDQKQTPIRNPVYSHANTQASDLAATESVKLLLM